jgi:uncharacterized protein
MMSPEESRSVDESSTAEPSAPRAPRGRTRRVLVPLLTALVVIATVAMVGGGWFFSGQIRAGALDVHAPSDEMTLRVVMASARSITLEETGERQEPLRHDETYGLAWESGYGQISGAARVDGNHVTRRLVLLEGSPPTDGQLARLERDAFPDDPTSVLGVPVKQVRYQSPAGAFAAWFAPGKGHTWAILVHGQRAARTETLRAMRITTATGLPSLAITYRNDTDAPRDPSHFYGFGRTEWRDLQAAVQFALDHGAEKLVLVGYSMGGGITAAFMQHSNLATHVCAIVLDSPMLDLGATIDHQAAERSLPLVGLPIPAPLTWTAKQLAAVRYHVDWDALDYLKDSNWLDVPTLVFHGDHDGTAPLATSQRLAGAHPDLVELVTVAHAEHVSSWNQDPHAYDRELSRFLVHNRCA